MEDATAKEILLESSSTSTKDLNLESKLSYFNSGSKEQEVMDTAETSKKHGLIENKVDRKLKEKSVSKESKICPICKKIFKKVTKKKYHTLTHTTLFKNLSIDNKIYWSDDRTSLSCRDCGKEFNQHGHMKVHIARVHYQLHNLKSWSPLDSSDIVEKVKKLDCDKKKTSQRRCM